MKMNAIIKITAILIVALYFCATAFAQEKAKHKEPPIRHVILPPEKKRPAPPLIKKALPPAERDLSPYMTASDEATLREALKAYRANNFAGAISETKRLLKQGEGEVPEVAAYFLGEFYLKQADAGGDKEALPNAVTAFQNAVDDYPKSNRTTYGQFRLAEVYIRRGFYHEALGNFKRLIDRGYDDEFTIKAKIGRAKTYQAWGRWSEAKSSFLKVLNEETGLSAEEKTIVLLGNADSLYQMGQFEAAYQGYKMVAGSTPEYRFSDSASLFQFGEAAYRSHHVEDAKSPFFYFYNIYPNHPLASVALLRIKTILAMEKALVASQKKLKVTLITPKIASIDDNLKRMAQEAIRASDKDPIANLGKILLALETIQNCLKTVPLKIADAKERLACNRPLAEEAFYPKSKLRLGLREGIKADALDLLKHGAPSTTAQGVLLEAIYHFKKYKDIEAVVEIETTLLMSLPGNSPYRKEVEDTLHETIVNELGLIREPEKIVTLYYSYPVAFTKEMLRSEIGYTIAMSHINTGLLTKGIALLQPVSENFRYPLWKEALYQIGKANLALGEYGEAQNVLEKYQRISTDKEKASADLGHLHFKRGDAPRAVLAYERWLSHFPKHHDRADVYLKLSEAYRYQNNFEKEIKVYDRWIAGEKTGLDVPLMRHADTHFQLGQYDKAISSYKAIVENKYGGEKEMEWAKLRLATSYDLAGQAKEGEKYFESLSRKKKNTLIKQIAIEKTNAH